MLAELGIELIGAPLDVIQRAEDRQLFKDAVESCGLQGAELADRHRRSTEVGEASALPAVVRPAFTLGGHGGGFASTREELRRQVEIGLRESPIGQVLVEESVRGWDEFELEVVRDRLDNVVIVCSIENLDPMGVHTGDSVTVAPQMTPLGRGVPGAARRRGRGHPRSRRRHRRLEHPVRALARDRRGARDRDEPARLALVGARVEGDRLPDREGRREARRRLHARRDPERPHRHDAGELRADARLRRREVPALRVREVPGRRPHARHADEVGRRDDGHRAHVRRGVPEGDAARASSTRAQRRRGRRSPTSPTTFIRSSWRRSGASRRRCSRWPAQTSSSSSRTTGCASSGSGSPTPTSRRRRTCRRRVVRARPARLRRPPVVPPRRLVRRRGRGGVELLLLDLGRGGRGGADGRQAARRHPRLGPEPDRAGDRVRLLLRPRRADVPRARLRGGDGQLQPGDGLDRLRHLRPALLRAARRRGGARRSATASSRRASSSSSAARRR